MNSITDSPHVEDLERAVEQRIDDNSTNLDPTHVRPIKPTALPVLFKSIPNQLSALDQWLLWCYEYRPEGTKPWTKIPKKPNGGNASSTNPETWSSFAKVRAAYEKGNFDGIGFVVTPETGIVGVDMDNQLIDDDWNDEVYNQIRSLQTYGEVSPSGRGARFFAQGTLPKIGRKRGDFEIYNSGRYLTVTGHKLEGTPGTINQRDAQLLEFHSRLIAPEDSPKDVIAIPSTPINLDDISLIEKAMNATNGAAFTALWNGDTSAYNGDRSAADLALCDKLRFWTQADSKRMDALFRQSALMRDKWDEKHRGDGATYGQITIEKALPGKIYTPRTQEISPHNSGWETADSINDITPPAKPALKAKPQSRAEQHQRRRAEIDAEATESGVIVIETNNRQQADELADLSHAIELFNAQTPRLFQGFDGLVRIVRDAKDTPRLKSATRSTIQRIAGLAARWIRTSNREGVFNVAPPRDLCEIYLDNQDAWTGIPPILGTVSAPSFAPDGTLCDFTGYHPAARFWLELPTNFELSDTSPTPENVKFARRLLLHKILGEVAFADDASRAHAIAQMILPFVRRMINGPTPLHLWNAPLRSSGKSYGAELCIWPFVEPTPMPEKANAEEWRKSLLSELKTGPSHVYLDNVKGSLNSAALDMAITSGVFRDRLTGTGDMVSAPANCVWVATANNAELTEDAETRSVLIQLDPNCENPEVRNFSTNPQEFIRHNRGQVCGAIITLVRAWQQAGCPSYSGSNRCRFPEWTRIMGGILDVAGIAGFLDNMAEKRQKIGEDASSEWHAFTESWFEEHESSYVSAAALMPLALKVEELAEPLELLMPGPRREKVLSEKIRKQRDRVFGSFKIKIGPQINRKKTFKVEKLEDDPKNQSPMTSETPDTSDATYTRETLQTVNGQLQETNRCGLSRILGGPDASGVSDVNLQEQKPESEPYTNPISEVVGL